MSLSLPRRHRAEAFWNWWKSRAGRLASARQGNDPVFDEAVERLQSFDDALGLEVSITPEGQRRLILTAYGDVDKRQSVLDLMQLKPELAGWEVVAFRPAEGSDFELEIGGVQLSGAKMWFEPLRDDSDSDFLGLQIYFEGDGDMADDLAKTAAGLAIMAVIGERSFMDEINLVRIGDSRTIDVQELIPLAQLPEYIEWARKRNKG